MDNIITLITSVLSLVFAGGWWVNYRQKKEQEKASAKSANVDAIVKEAEGIEGILQKYTDVVASTMGSNAEEHKKIHAKLDHICQQNDKLEAQYSDVVEYLNGDYQKFLKSKGR